MLIKIIIIIAMLAIVASLASSLTFLVRDNNSNNKRIVKALSWRIGLSVALFIFLFIAFALGWIAPHGLGQT